MWNWCRTRTPSGTWRAGWSIRATARCARTTIRRSSTRTAACTAPCVPPIPARSRWSTSCWRNCSRTSRAVRCTSAVTRRASAWRGRAASSKSAARDRSTWTTSGRCTSWCAGAGAPRSSGATCSSTIRSWPPSSPPARSRSWKTTRRTPRSTPTPRPACRRGCRSTSRRGSTAGAPSSATRPPRWPTSAVPVRARRATARPACSTPTGATTATGSTFRWRFPATRTVRPWAGRRRRTRTWTCRPRWTRTPSATRPA